MNKSFVICAILILLFCKCGNKDDSADGKVVLAGLGDTFPQVFYDITIPKYMNETGNIVIYNEITSGEGNRVFYDKIFDFLVTDTSLNDLELAECGNKVLHIPCALGAIVLAYNVPEIKELNLNSAVITAIYRGEITQWDDPAIAEINRGTYLPHCPIRPVYRSDANGVTYLFSDFLSQTCPEWKKQIGLRKTLHSCTGVAARGNINVADAIENTVGSIGYISMDLASLLDLPVAAIQNASGCFVHADRHSLQVATEKEFPDDMRATFINSEKADAYPIPCLSWILVYQNQAYNHRGKRKYRSLTSFLKYIVSSEVQINASKLTDSPLPPAFIQKAQKMIQSITWKEENDER